jgi:hypothetical protein
VATRFEFDSSMPLRADVQKTLVMEYLRQFAADGHAEWVTRKNGGIELRFHTGETFILADTTMTRIA